MKKEYSPAFKAKIALEAFKEIKTLSEIASAYEVHPNLLRRWKRELSERAEELFSDKRKNEERSAERLQTQLYQQIDQLKVELDWLKKKSGLIN